MKKFKPTCGMISAAKAVFMAMAYTATIREIVEGYQNEILRFYQFKVAEKWTGTSRETFAHGTVITDPKHTYLMEEVDFQLYLKECRAAMTKAGLTVDDPDHCPLLVAESLQRSTELVLFNTMEPLTGITHEKLLASGDFLENRAKYLELTLKLLAPFVGNAKELMAA